MLVKRAMHLALLAVALLWQARCGAAPAAVKFCGRQLGEIMSRVCHAYNSPSWDVPTVVVEQTGSLVRRRRHLGIADECCTMGCTWEQLSKYCSVSAYSESPMDDIETHMIADRSAEQAAGPPSPAVVGNSVPGPQSGGARREGLVENAARAAPVVGTVSPLLTWGRTLNTDLPIADENKYAYVAIYT
ncbi:insulin-like peptide isoform X3 [Plodia interpunctella]|uniref:insulin-like peptide isoform X3 n=1 Tax=Plodia interpunctella TaxID=58824 RepID=UPI002367AFE0|nr:insulin-like peptide isoform X3 [Plodia interpunctella]